MAHARIVHAWPDGSRIRFEMHLEDSFPVLRMYREAIPADESAAE